MGERSGDPVPLQVRRPGTGCGEQQDEQDGSENRAVRARPATGPSAFAAR